MGVFATNESQISYIYSASSDFGKEQLPYLEAMDERCRIIDIDNDPLSDTSWTEIADMANLHLSDLFSSNNHDDFQTNANAKFDTNGWLKIIAKNPRLLVHPIIVKGKTAKQIKSRAEILSFIGVDSAGLKKNGNIEKPITSSRTEDESWVNGKS